MSRREKLNSMVALIAAMISSAPAGAADMQQAVLRSLPPPLWTGFHVGADMGGVIASDDGTTVFFGAPTAFSTNPSGTVGGIAFGYDYQFSPNWLVGAELELSWSSARASFNFITAAAPGVFPSGMLTTNHNWYDTFTGRVGYVLGNWLLYAKGGAAWINATYGLAFAQPFPGGSVTDTRAGYDLGLGAEWMFVPGWSAKIEYDYLGFGSHSYTFAGVGTSVDIQVQLVKVGVNYQLHPGGFFGWF
jgi:opacity protein-like surface antigen